MNNEIECPHCNRTFRNVSFEEAAMNAWNAVPQISDVEMLRIDSQYLDVDMQKNWVVTAVKKEFYYIPVYAQNEEEAEEKAEKAMDKYGEQQFIEEFYFDDEWEMNAQTFEKAGYRCKKEYIIT